MKLIAAALVVVAACDGGGSGPSGDDGDDLPVDANPDCNPATVLPTTWRPIASVATTAVTLTDAGGTLTGTIDARAGGNMAAAADNPYVYVNLATGTKVDVTDLDARDNLDWDIALKRSSVRTNGGDSGGGRRRVAVVVDATSLNVVAPPPNSFTEDDFTSDDCEYVSIPGGEPMSALGEWYDYDVMTHAVTPRSDVYVIERNDGSRTAFRFTSWYGTDDAPGSAGVFELEAKAL